VQLLPLDSKVSELKEQVTSKYEIKVNSKQANKQTNNLTLVLSLEWQFLQRCEHHPCSVFPWLSCIWLDCLWHSSRISSDQNEHFKQQIGQGEGKKSRGGNKPLILFGVV
jgi:hypothetical protein